MLATLFRATLLVCFASSTLLAQDYSQNIEIDWTPTTKQLKIGENQEIRYLHFEDADYDQSAPQIPIFSKQLDLRTYGTLTARLVNDQYAPLDDTKDIDLSDIKTTIEIGTAASFAHKKPVGVYYFVPIRKNPTTGVYEKLVQAEVQIQVTAQANPYTGGTARNVFNTTVSQLSDGAIYKISIEKTGVHKIDYKLLQDLGVDVDNIDPRKIQILGNGGEALPERMTTFVPDDLVENSIEIIGENDGSFDANDYILFYGIGTKTWNYDRGTKVFTHSTNVYTDKSHYFIKIANTNGKRIVSRASAPNATYTTNAYDALAHHEVDEINLMEQEFALPPSGRVWYGEAFRITRNRSFPFNFSNRIESEPINVYSDLAARVFTNGSATLSVNGTLMDTKSTPSTTVYIYTDYAKTVRFSNKSPIVTGQNVNVDIGFNHSASDAEMWLNYLTIHARCQLSFNGAQLPFRDTRSFGYPVANYVINNGENATVWDITEPTNAVLQQKTGSGTSTFGADATINREFIAFDNSQLYTPLAVGSVANQNLHGTTTPPQAIFVCHSSLRDQAERLAAHRRSHSNMTVDVVNVEDIYNEFSSGNEDITAIRNFCRMLYARENPSNEFTHILLFGLGTFDYKSLGNGRDASNNPNLVPLYQTPQSLHPISTYTSDDYFTLLDSTESMGAFGLLDLAVGRLPAANITEATTMVDKIIDYDTNPDAMADWYNRLLFIADDGDNNLHFNDAEGIIRTSEYRDSTYNIEKIYIDAFRRVSTSGGSRYPDAKNALLDAIFKGSFVVNYLGHGGDNGWTQERIFTSADISNLTNSKELPLFITATCSFGPHDDPNTVSAGELLLLNPNGGAVSLFTTVRVVIASHNERLVNNTFNVIFTPKANGQMPTTGEVMLFAKNNAAINPPTNSRKYALLGDPTMTLAYPTYDVNTTKINGNTVGSIDTIKALQRVTIEGEIVDNNGNKISNFNGLIYPTVFDKEDKLYTLGNDNSSYVDDFLLRKKIIFKGQASVVNGNFSFTFVVPKDINYTIGQGKISYYASDGVSLDAHGYYNKLLVGGSDNNAVADNTPPEVLVYMNTEEFARGGLTDKNPTLLAKLYDENGINTVGNSIGHDLAGTLTTKEGVVETYILNDFYTSTTDDYTKGTIRYPLKDLPVGLHHIKVKAWDTYNNPGEGDTEFLVAESADLALKHVLNYPNPFTTSTNFQFEHNYPYQDLEIQVQVYTVSGKLVKTILQDVYAETNTGYRVSDIHWNGLDDYGDRLGKGVYIYKIQVQAAGTTDASKQVSEFEKLVILK